MYPIGPKPPTQDFRLPTNVKPSAYSVSLKPDIENGTFEGNVVINVDVKNPTRIIELNAKDLVVSRAVLTTDSGACEAKTELIPKTERLVLTFATPVPTGKGTIALDFTGVLNDQMTGFYRSSYSANGEKRLMATTQFEDTDARRAFPCFNVPYLYFIGLHLSVCSPIFIILLPGNYFWLPTAYNYIGTGKNFLFQEF